MAKEILGVDFCGNTMVVFKTMSDRHKQNPKPVRLYPPIQKAWDRLDQEDNFNYYVNMCLAEKLGVQVDLNLYRRPKNDS